MKARIHWYRLDRKLEIIAPTSMQSELSEALKEVPNLDFKVTEATDKSTTFVSEMTGDEDNRTALNLADELRSKFPKCQFTLEETGPF